MNIPENQYKFSLKWLYHHGDEFLLTITEIEVMKGQKKQDSYYLGFQIVPPPPALHVILFMVNLD